LLAGLRQSALENNIRRVTAILSLLAGIVKARAENGIERLTYWRCQYSCDLLTSVNVRPRLRRHDFIGRAGVSLELLTFLKEARS
jgi:hypothetical protein